MWRIQGGKRPLLKIKFQSHWSNPVLFLCFSFLPLLPSSTPGQLRNIKQALVPHLEEAFPTPRKSKEHGPFSWGSGVGCWPRSCSIVTVCLPLLTQPSSCPGIRSFICTEPYRWSAGLGACECPVSKHSIFVFWPQLMKYLLTRRMGEGTNA